MTDTVDLLAERAAAREPRPQAPRERWRRTSRERTFPAGSVVIREGDTHGIGFFVVVAGDGVVTVGGKEVDTVGPGSYFGEVALISDRVRTATVTATTDLDVPGHDVLGLPGVREGRSGGRLAAARARRRPAPRPALIPTRPMPLPLAVQLYTFRDPARFGGAGMGLDPATLEAIAAAGFLGVETVDVPGW